ncbi:MAG: septum formation inhibitor Maf [Magnetococcales bacterium]|nr:septum formation inhibitor Maf [Magnetococcales bacterium]
MFLENFPKTGENAPISPPFWQPEGLRLRLASASERRLTLLRQVGLNPEVCPGDVDESRLPGEEALQYVERMARTKARAGWHPRTDLVIGADTAVVLGEEIMGKPKDPEEAGRMLARLSGQTHRVLTGIAVLGGRPMTERARVTTSTVQVKRLSSNEINAYIATGEPMDKAGAYGIQGLGAFLVARVEGSYSGVVGLPLYETLELLASFGLTFSDTR